MVLFFFFPQIYRSCITFVSRKTVLSSQSDLTMKEALPGGPDSTPAEVLSKWETFFMPIPVSSPRAACLLMLLCAGLYPANVHKPSQ